MIVLVTKIRLAGKEKKPAAMSNNIRDEITFESSSFYPLDKGEICSTLNRHFNVRFFTPKKYQIVLYHNDELLVYPND